MCPYIRMYIHICQTAGSQARPVGKSAGAGLRAPEATPRETRPGDNSHNHNNNNNLLLLITVI